MESCFVRKDFYIDPPANGAPVSEWEEWQRRDRLLAAAAKRAHTRSLPPADVDDRPDTAAHMVKQNGRWVQSVAIGLTGDFESGNGSLEPIEEATQDRVVMSPWIARSCGTNRKGQNERKKRARQRKAARKAHNK